MQAKPPLQRPKPPGRLERLGVRFYRQLEGGPQPPAPRSLTDLPPDAVLQRRAARIGWEAAGWSLLVGALTTLATVAVEWVWQPRLDPWTYWALQGAATLAMLAVEFAVLFWASLRAVRQLAQLTHPGQTTDPHIPGYEDLPHLLARAALEIPDPTVRFLGIDPLKRVNRARALLVGLLYKAKIFLTSALVKFVLSRALGKGATRLSLSWVSIPVTGIWNAIVAWRVVREARLRLFGHRLAQHLAQTTLAADSVNRLSPAGQQATLQALACAVVLAQRVHPNVLLLLVQVHSALPHLPPQNLDDWEAFCTDLLQLPPPERAFVLDLLAVALALDGKLSALERRELPAAFAEHAPAYLPRILRLKTHLWQGRLQAALADCGLDFKPG